jgi:adenylate cyclase
VVKTIGDEVMAVFGAPDAAAAAAAEMQVAVDSLPPVANNKLGLRIGFHFGPVLQENDDVFGDTVNLAARLVAQAVKGQIITTSATADMLPPPLRGMTRDLYAINVKGKAEEISLCEVIWKRHDEDTTVMVSGRRPAAKKQPVVLKLKYRDKEITRRRDTDAIDVGRDPACGLVIADHMASRQHCTLERRQDRYVLKDHSTNGTYVTMEGDTEQHLLREEVTLRKHGWIAFGQPRAQAAPEEVVEFFVDS